MTVQRLLMHPRLPWLAALLGLILALPSLTSSRFADDHFQRITLTDPPRPPWLKEISAGRFKLDIFRFFDGDIERNDRIINHGIAPWWTSRDAKGAFFRPLSALTHWIDYQLFPGDSWAINLQSVLWYAATVLIVAHLYRRIGGATIATGVAMLLFAVDDAHGLPIGFLANRNALIAAAFGAASVLFYDRWIAPASWSAIGGKPPTVHPGDDRPTPVTHPASRANLLGSLLCYLLALFAGEAGIATLAYVGAHLLCLDRRSWRARLLSSVPFLAITILWRAGWNLGGYGVATLGVYIDPLHDPVGFAAALAFRLPILLLGQWFMPPADAAIVLQEFGAATLWISAISFLGLLAWALRKLLRADAIARFWAVGMLLSAIPVSATFPSNRLLMFVGIGAFGLLGRAAVVAIETWRAKQLPPLRRKALRTAVVVAVLVHAVFAPLSLSLGAMFGPGRMIERMQIQTPMDASVENQTVVVMNAPMSLLVGALPVARAMEGKPIPLRVLMLSPGFSAVEIHRHDDRTLIVRPDPPFLSWSIDRLFRDPDDPLQLGDEVRRTDVTITVTGIERRGRPKEVTYRFHVPLEDPSLRWVRWSGSVFIAAAPPVVGESVRYPRATVW